MHQYRLGTSWRGSSPVEKDLGCTNGCQVEYEPTVHSYCETGTLCSFRGKVTASLTAVFPSTREMSANWSRGAPRDGQWIGAYDAQGEAEGRGIVWPEEGKVNGGSSYILQLPKRPGSSKKHVVGEGRVRSCNEGDLDQT